MSSPWSLPSRLLPLLPGPQLSPSGLPFLPVPPGDLPPPNRAASLSQQLERKRMLLVPRSSLSTSQRRWSQQKPQASSSCGHLSPSIPEEAAVTRALDGLFLCPVILITARDSDPQLSGPPLCRTPYSTMLWLSATHLSSLSLTVSRGHVTSHPSGKLCSSRSSEAGRSPYRCCPSDHQMPPEGRGEGVSTSLSSPRLSLCLSYCCASHPGGYSVS